MLPASGETLFVLRNPLYMLSRDLWGRFIKFLYYDRFSIDPSDNSNLPNDS